MANQKIKWPFTTMARLEQAAGQIEKLQSEVNELKENNSQQSAELLRLREELEESKRQKTALSQSMQLRINTIEAEKEALLARAVKLEEEFEEAKTQAQTFAMEKEAELENSKNLLLEVREENELILKQMFQLQEELEDLFIKKQTIVDENNLIKARWSRLEKRIPNYVDWSKVEIVSHQVQASQTQIVWRAFECYQASFAYPEISFETIIKDGLAGIMMKFGNERPYVLYPQKLLTDPKGLEFYLQLSAPHFRHLHLYASILEQVIAQQWRDIGLPDDLDPNFWQSSLENFVRSFKKLPKGLRYERVLLKQEQQNIDYEHLWLEIQGLYFGTQFIPSLEIRIGAANVDPQFFSRYPKFEFPLIGDEKPFESWYAESSDDFGSKFELRVDLNRKTLDVATLKKLSLSDQSLVIALLKRTPQFLSELVEAKATINRPWINWVSLVREVSELLTAKS